jgi:hypothetical protein
MPVNIISRSDPGYQFVYFNEMNLAVKSPALTRRAITPDILRLLTEVHILHGCESILPAAANDKTDDSILLSQSVDFCMTLHVMLLTSPPPPLPQLFSTCNN